MQTPNDAIVMGVLIGIAVLLIAASFIVILVTYSNGRKRHYLQDKKNMELLFNQQLLNARLEIQEHTSNQISQEIHDNVGQLLCLAKVQVNLLEAGKGNKTEIFRELKDNISTALTDLRDIAKSLNTDKIKQLTLIELANHELLRINRLGIIKAFLTSTGNPKEIDEQKKLVILRIMQECLQNIIKHAEAKMIEVMFNFEQDHFTVTIKDDGCGFDSAATNPGSGLGLGNIINRAQLINGQASINSAVGFGTSVTITAPYE